ncbi:hypothetical protein [Cohnella sp.]
MNIDRPWWFWVLGAFCIVTLIVLELRSRREKKEQSSSGDPSL